MVTVPKEKTFPRGGHVERTDAPRRKIPDWCKNKFLVHKKKDLLGTKKTSKSKNLSRSTYEEDEGTISDKYPQIQSTNTIRPYTGLLRYNGISEGMLILGCIYKIEPYNLGISLPGNCVGHVPIINISEPYRQALSSLVSRNVSSDIHYLRDMFRVGQHVVTKVMKKEMCDEDIAGRSKIVLSLSPQDIHSEWSSRDIRAQSVFTAAVVSIEEKVYVMDLGIKSVRAVLKKEHAETFRRVWNEEKELGIGQLVRCVVLNVTTEKSVSTVTLSADPYAVTKASCNKIGSAFGRFLPGMLFNVTVARHLFPSGIQVRLSENVMGYVPHNHFPRSFRNPEDFQIGSVHPARVLYISQSGAIFFTMKKNVCLAQPLVSPFKALKAGFVANNATVWRVSETGLTVKLTKSENVSFKGHISMSHVDFKNEVQDSDLPFLSQLASVFPVGSEITCRVVDYCYMDQYYVCTMKKSLMKETYLHPSSLKVGVVVPCIIKEINSKGITVSLGKDSPVNGFVPRLHMADVPLTHPEKKFNVNQACMARVLRLDNCVHLTMKQSLIQSPSILTSYAAAEVGKKYLGTVVHRNQSGILVEFFSNITGWINRLFLSKKPLHPSAVETEFYLGQVVSCMVVRKEDASQRLILSLIAGYMLSDSGLTDGGTNEERAPQLNSEMNENVIDTDTSNDRKSKKHKKKLNKADESVDTESQEKYKLQKRKSKKKCENDIDCCDFAAPKKKLKLIADDASDDESHPNLGQTGEKSKKENGKTLSYDSVETKIKVKTKNSKTGHEVPDDVNESKKKRKLSTNPVYEAVNTTRDSVASSPDTRKSNTQTEPFSETFEDTTEKKKKRKRKSSENKDKTTAIDSSEYTGNSVEMGIVVTRKPIELPSLSGVGFVWDATPNSLPAVTRITSDDDSSDDEDDNKPKKEKRSRQAIVAEKRHQAQLEEARLRSIEHRLMDPGQVPQTADEFDRLVLASPDNSMVWLQYMAYHIQATEIDKARNVAKRALRTISFREEQEKLNVWMALLNLENLYGTVDTVKSTFEEAIKLNDPYAVYTQMLQVYGDSHKLTEADDLIATMVKKFKSVKDMWINVATFYMKGGQLVKARALLQRALSNLDKKEHVSVISQFALLENKLGSQERAQTLMEQILTSYPKRVDVWSVYVDMLVKSNLIAMARQVLERAVAQRLQAHKMKALFKKFLAFEEAHGSEEGANRVRQMALEYVEAATSNNTE